MFEDGENTFNDSCLNDKCSFCGKVIKMFPASNSDNTLKFCDLICAKLYYDNVQHFLFDVKRYNNYYNEYQLSDKAREVFDRCRFVMFEQLPVYRPLKTDETYNDPKLMKKIYDKILS